MSQSSLSARTEASSRVFLPPFSCSWESDGFGAARVHLGGELDLSTTALFGETLRDAQRSADVVTVDLQQLTFIDCAALGVLLDVSAVARAAGGKLILKRGSGQVDRVLVLTGACQQLDFVDLHLDGGLTSR
jgi:anti-anti-sigma factor